MWGAVCLAEKEMDTYRRRIASVTILELTDELDVVLGFESAHGTVQPVNGWRPRLDRVRVDELKECARHALANVLTTMESISTQIIHPPFLHKSVAAVKHNGHNPDATKELSLIHI